MLNFASLRPVALAPAALVLAMALASPAAAQTVVADTDGDGVFSLAELQAAYPSVTAETFATLDVDASGSIDADELQAGIEGGTITG